MQILTTGSDKVFRPPAWFGEFGWEVMSWAPWCRARSREAETTCIVSFGSSRALYADFATRFADHGGTDRSLNYPKDGSMYRVRDDGFEHRRYGRRLEPRPYDVMLHARGARWRKAPTLAWPRFEELAALLIRAGLEVASYGTEYDYHVPGTADERCNDLSRDMDLLASARLACGCSSGPLHLAAACGCDLVVWGDTKTRYGEPLEKRYRETWNPHAVRVGWLGADDWDPAVDEVFDTIENML